MASYHHPSLKQRRKQQAADCEWIQNVDLDGTNAMDRFGEGAVISGDGTTFAVGSPFSFSFTAGDDAGNVRIFSIKEDGIGATLLGEPIFGEASFDLSGHSLALSADGRTVAISARFNDGEAIGNVDTGQVRVFRYTSESSTWSQLGVDINGEAMGDFSGISVSLSEDGNIVAIGATENDGTGEQSGHVRVYQLESGSRWVQVGSDVDGTSAGDRLGSSVSLSADGLTFAVVAVVDTGSETHINRVFRYYASSGWTQLGGDIEVDGVAGGRLQLSLSADGLTVSAGSPGSASVDATVFTLTANNEWIRLGNPIEDGAEGDQAGFATSLSEDGRTLAMGAIQDGNGGAGYVRVYRYSSASEDWQQIGQDLVGAAAGDRFGFAVSISNDGTRIIAGDPDDFDTEGELRGHARVFSIEPTCLSDPPTATPIAQEPTRAPTGPPLTSGTTRQAQFEGIRLDFVGVDALSVSEKTIFQDVHKQWYEAFFDSFGPAAEIQQMETTILFREQSTVIEDSQGTNTTVRSTVRYDQSISYTEIESSVPAEDLIPLPFLDEEENLRYGDLLAERINAFSDAEFPISPPVLSVSSETNPTDISASESISTGAIAGIAVGGVVGIALVVYLAYFLTTVRNSRNSHGAGVDDSSPPGQGEGVAASVIAVPVLQYAPTEYNTDIVLPSYKDQVRSVARKGQVLRGPFQKKEKAPALKISHFSR